MSVSSGRDELVINDSLKNVKSTYFEEAFATLCYLLESKKLKKYLFLDFILRAINYQYEYNAANAAMKNVEGFQHLSWSGRELFISVNDNNPIGECVLNR